jgi:hypothetical protein
LLQEAKPSATANNAREEVRLKAVMKKDELTQAGGTAVKVIPGLV